MKTNDLVLMLLHLHWNNVGLNTLGYFTWCNNARSWSCDRFGTDLVEGAD